MEKEEDINEVPLEDLVSLLKEPPLLDRITSGKNFLKRNEKVSFYTLKRGYNASLERVINLGKKTRQIAFRSFLRRYKSYFEGDYDLLDSLNNENLEYVISSLQFDGEVRKNRFFIPGDVSNLDQ